MIVHEIDPLCDLRWSEFLQRHPQASIFHTRGWLEGLRRTYGYKPIFFTTSGPEEELKDGLLFCHVNSWITGRRLVSLPFSDHCQPLVSDAGALKDLLSYLHHYSDRHSLKYIELRPLILATSDRSLPTSFSETKSFCFHKLDLQFDLDELFRGFHKSCVQRKIRRAERETLDFEEGASELLLTKFYHLFLLTRRRHSLPPPPLAWFQHLIECLGRQLKIRVVSRKDRPVAAILTLSFKESVVYKYGCSDPRFNNLGGMVFLLWKAIQEAKASGAREFDLGRSDWKNSGLVAFKDHWNATQSELTYYRYPPLIPADSGDGWKMQLAKRVIPRIPDRLLTLTGSAMYRHYG